MNLSVMYEHIAYQLQTQVTTWSQDGHLLGRYTTRTDLDEKQLTDEQIYRQMISYADDYPVLVTANGELVYALVPLENLHCVIGPVRLLFPKNVYRQAQIPEAKDMDGSLFPICTAEEVLDYALLLFRLCGESTMVDYECYMRNCDLPQATHAYVHHTKTLYSFREEGGRHNPYEQEQRIMQAIESGDFGLLDASRKEQASGGFGVSSRDPIRNGKNLAETNIVLCSRACIRGGVDPEVGFSLCDSYMQQVENMLTIEEMKKLPTLIENMQYTMTRLVHDLKEERKKASPEEEAPLIQKCKQYISLHLHEKLKVQDIANALYVHPNYLTNCFSEAEGMPLHQYIVSEKLRTARQLLIYSPKPISEIALTLSFASQSHLGTLFRKKYGMSPKEYRDRHGKIS